MFTGIIETSGKITSIHRSGTDIRLGIEPLMRDFDVKIGGSVAVDGVCLTVESVAGHILYFTAVFETLGRTTLAQLRQGSVVNLERALAVSGRFDGHIVLGHVDGTGRIEHDETIGQSLWRTISVPEAMEQFMAEKGSVAIDGISLTIARYRTGTIAVSFIPHTLALTTMSQKKPGDTVNLECDVLARYMAQNMTAGKIDSKTENTPVGSSLMGKLEAGGF